MTCRSDELSEPRRDRPVSATDLERSITRGNAEGGEIPTVHGVEQPRHQCQAGLLAMKVMIEDVLGHAADARRSRFAFPRMGGW